MSRARGVWTLIGQGGTRAGHAPSGSGWGIDAADRAASRQSVDSMLDIEARLGAHADTPWRKALRLVPNMAGDHETRLMLARAIYERAEAARLAVNWDRAYNQRPTLEALCVEVMGVSPWSL